jgi:L-alanine-DL-glutamate epimerase-like enolase superfamily enzyme
MIEKIRLDRVSIPLSRPYRLSTVTVNSFDVVLVRVHAAGGHVGLGEVTSLKKYSTEDDDDVWRHLRRVGETLPGIDPVEAVRQVSSALKGYPFSMTGLVSAVETAVCGDWPTGEAPVVGILSANDSLDACKESLRTQLESGLNTIKLKIGFDPETDAQRLNRLREEAPQGVRFRVDANQGYSLAEARHFLSRACTTGLAHLEQPLPVGNLASHAKLTAESPVDIVLDEEVATVEDLELIDEADAANGVKFKLMKCGGLTRARELISEADRRGFTVIFGNGVQSDIGCLLEATVWSETGLETVGEFNGWQKQSINTIESVPEFRDGCLHWDGTRPTLDNRTLNQYRTDSIQFERS